MWKPNLIDRPTSKYINPINYVDPYKAPDEYESGDDIDCVFEKSEHTTK